MGAAADNSRVECPEGKGDSVGGAQVCGRKQRHYHLQSGKRDRLPVKGAEGVRGDGRGWPGLQRSAGLGLHHLASQRGRHAGYMGTHWCCPREFSPLSSLSL